MDSQRFDRVFPEDDTDRSKEKEALFQMLNKMSDEQEKPISTKRYQVAIDPGNTHTALVVVEIETKKIVDSYKLPNEEMRKKLHEIRYVKYGGDCCDFAIEMVASYGMPVGRSVFDTCLWIGRYIEIWGAARLITRIMAKNHICKSTRATDANIRQSLMDRYGSTREAAVGTKKNPGPMYGMGNDERAALAVALTAIETKSAYEMSKAEEIPR